MSIQTPNVVFGNIFVCHLGMFKDFLDGEAGTGLNFKLLAKLLGYFYEFRTNVFITLVLIKSLPASFSFLNHDLHGKWCILGSGSDKSARLKSGTRQHYWRYVATAHN